MGPGVQAARDDPGADIRLCPSAAATPDCRAAEVAGAGAPAPQACVQAGSGKDRPVLPGQYIPVRVAVVPVAFTRTIRPAITSPTASVYDSAVPASSTRTAVPATLQRTARGRSGRLTVFDGVIAKWIVKGLSRPVVAPWK